MIVITPERRVYEASEEMIPRDYPQAQIGESPENVNRQMVIPDGQSFDKATEEPSPKSLQDEDSRQRVFKSWKERSLKIEKQQAEIIDRLKKLERK